MKIHPIFEQDINKKEKEKYNCLNPNENSSKKNNYHLERITHE